MTRSLFALVVCVVGSLPALAGIAPDNTSIHVLRIDPRLRSAFLLREVGLPAEYRYSDAEGLRSQLQTHFDAVLEKLEANRERSLALAMARLERRQGVRWNATQRSYWHRYLSEQRNLNIQRLIAYRDRGLFPLNEGHDAEGAPIFVDNHDTACAVGHLMRESGWEREVELIAATNLLVYVTDVRSGPLVNWVLQSGLTLGEAALIQPVYAPPVSEVPMNSLGSIAVPATFFDGTGERTIANGLLYENFHWRKLNILASPPSSPTISGLWNPESRSDIGVRDDYQSVVGRDDGCDVCVPEYSAAWPYANLLSVAPDADTYAIGTGLSAYAVSFDVVSTRPSLGIDRLGVFLPYGFNRGTLEAWTYVTESPPILPQDLSVLTFPGEKGGTPLINYSPQMLLGSLYSVADLFSSGGVEQNEDSVIIDPRQRVRVHTFILVRTGEFGQPSTFGAITHEIRLAAIPEPSCAILACCFAVGLVWRRS